MTVWGSVALTMKVAELLDERALLEGEVELRALDDDVGEVEGVELEGVEEGLPRDDELVGLLLDGERADELRDLLCSLPLGQLAEALLARPDAAVDDLEEELPRARIEDEQGAVGGLGGHVALVRLVCGDAVHVGVVDEPDDLVGEELAVVGRVEVGLCGLQGVELEPLADALPEDKERGVGLHDLGHGLLHQQLHPR